MVENMKSYCKNMIITMDDVLDALETWKDGESGRKNAHRVIGEYGSDDALVEEIYAQIRDRSLSFRPIHRYEHVEPTNGKVRVIGVESVKQQVCDYLAVTLMEHLYADKIGYYQVAAVKGKGQRACRTALRRWVRRSKYHVKLDVRKCYPSTKPSVVMSVYERYVKSRDVLYLVSRLLSTYDNGGLEIGSYFALKTMQLILSFGYHHVESLGRRRRGRWIPLVRHQIWHLDDILLMSNNKRDLKMAARSLSRFLHDSFGLSVKPWKVKVVSQSEPLDIGGWVVRVGMGGRARVTLRRGTFLRTTRTFSKFSKRPSLALARRCASRWGQLFHADSRRVVVKRNIDLLFHRARHMVSMHDRLVRLEQS